MLSHLKAVSGFKSFSEFWSTFIPQREQRANKRGALSDLPPIGEIPHGLTLGSNGQRLWSEDESRFDPYQVFEVEHRPCILFHVKILRGRNITKGWAADLLDTPDPYIELRMRTAPDGKKRTTTIDNEPNPVWNEDFVFLLDYNEKNILQISLMEDNYVYDQTLGISYFNVNDLVKNKWEKRTLIFNEVTEVDAEFMMELDTEPTLRYSLCLCQEEKDFLAARKSKVMNSMRHLLGFEAPRNISEVPTVAVIGSGGGFRAMVGMSGVTKALSDSGVLDCATYMAGLSGSSWYISTLYSHPNWPQMCPGDMQEELKNNIDSSLLWLLKPQSVCRYIDRILEKRRQGQPVSFTDFFGHMVGETLLKGRLDSKLTDQQAKIQDGDVPMPLYTCVHVKKDVSARSFQEWVEFTPFEIGMPKYGTYMKTNLFGSKFFMGKLCKEFEEPPLHFLLGIWGSAFCILFNRLLDDNRKLDPVEMIRLEMEKQLDDEDCSSDSSDDDDDDNNDDDEADVEPPPMKKRKVIASSRPPLKRQKSVHKKQSKGFWNSFVKGLVENKKFEILSTRAGRAGVVHNFMRGLALQQSYPLSPFSPIGATKTSTSDEFDGIFEMYPTNIKRLYMVDAGLTFNSPFPLVLRPQRGTDLILSFDFSARPSDNTHPFKELLLAEKWARLNRLSFPPIDVSVFNRDGMKELYIFRHPTDPHCPIVLHFVLVNLDFKMYKKPGIPRRTVEDKEFANFELFDDPSTPYSTFNFKYSHLAFDRLSKLTEFNTLKHIKEIKEVIADCVRKRRSLPPKLPISSTKVKLLRIKSVDNRRRLTNYLKKMESLCSPTSPLANGFFQSIDEVSEEEETEEESAAEKDVFVAPSSSQLHRNKFNRK